MAIDIDLEKALADDNNLQEGYAVYQDLEKKANDVAEEISTKLIESIIKEESEFNISTAILATAKTLSHLASFLYDSEEEFLNDALKARTAITTDVIPALLDPQPCMVCDNCKNGLTDQCMDPSVRADYTLSSFLPIVSDMLIEYDLFNKIIYMYTVGRDELGMSAES